METTIKAVFLALQSAKDKMHLHAGGGPDSAEVAAAHLAELAAERILSESEAKITLTGEEITVLRGFLPNSVEPRRTPADTGQLPLNLSAPEDHCLHLCGHDGVCRNGAQVPCTHD